MIVLIESPLPLEKLRRFQPFEDESGEEEGVNDMPTLVTRDVGELLLTKRSLYVTKTPCEES